MAVDEKLLQEYLDGYYNVFGVDFPLTQSPNMDKAMKHIGQCMYRQKKAEVLYPEIYGSVAGKNV